MTATTYLGYTNYQTWNWKLHIDNEYDRYQQWTEKTQQYIDGHGHDGDDWDDTICQLARELKDEAEANVPEISGAYMDILQAAIEDINWYEIAQELIEDNL